jgi:hypothetical protein
MSNHRDEAYSIVWMVLKLRKSDSGCWQKTPSYILMQIYNLFEARMPRCLEAGNTGFGCTYDEVANCLLQVHMSGRHHKTATKSSSYWL